MKFTTGAVFGNRYTLGERIAVGGMGEVWEATDQVLGRVVAIKLLNPMLAGQPGFAQRFREEARNTAALSHPNIAAVYDYGEDDGASWLVMELVPGRPLSAIIAEDGPQSPERTSAIIAQAALALHAAHEAGVIHRDVKPANILVRPDGTVKLTDFGIARAVGAAPITRTGEVMGTAQYISPEQATGQQVSPASDVYGLGCVAHEMLTGHRPFDEGSPVATAMAHIQKEPPPLPPTVPAHVAAVVMACLAKDPAQRPGSARAVAGALRGAPVAGFATTQAMPAVGATERIGAAPTAYAPAMPPPRTGTSRRVEAESEPPRRGRAWMWIVPLLLVLAVAGFLLAQAGFFRGSPEPNRTTPVPTTQTSTTQTSTTATTPATSTTTQEQVTLSEGDYVGRSYDDVARALSALGLSPERVDVDGDEAKGTVLGLSPTSELAKGATVRVRVSKGPRETPTSAPSTPAPETTRPTAPPAQSEEPNQPPQTDQNENAPGQTGSPGQEGPAAGNGAAVPESAPATTDGDHRHGGQEPRPGQEEAP